MARCPTPYTILLIQTLSFVYTKVIYLIYAMYQNKMARCPTLYHITYSDIELCVH
jgi:hypothetical protein